MYENSIWRLVRKILRIKNEKFAVKNSNFELVKRNFVLKMPFFHPEIFVFKIQSTSFSKKNFHLGKEFRKKKQNFCIYRTVNGSNLIRIPLRKF